MAVIKETGMPYRKNEFYQGGYYHIFNRGVNRERVFFSEENYLYCLRLVRKYVERYFVSVIAYCLMPNHYHFILRQNSKKSLSEFMRVVFNAYVQAVNKQRGRMGTLFEGRFKHIHIDEDKYILHLCRYIHLNPVEAKLVRTPEEWPFSNYNDWVGKRNGKLIDANLIASYFKSPKEYERFVLESKIDEVNQRKLQTYLLE
ncbi:MAG: transposase [bacterium]